MGAFLGNKNQNIMVVDDEGIGIDQSAPSVCTGVKQLSWSRELGNAFPLTLLFRLNLLALIYGEQVEGQQDADTVQRIKKNQSGHWSF